VNSSGTGRGYLAAAAPRPCLGTHENLRPIGPYLRGMQGHFPLAALAQFGEALGLLLQAQDDRPNPELGAVAPSFEDGNGLIRSVLRLGGKVRPHQPPRA
jgi:hypothetical protein